MKMSEAVIALENCLDEQHCKLKAVSFSPIGENRVEGWARWQVVGKMLLVAELTDFGTYITATGQPNDCTLEQCVRFMCNVAKQRFEDLLGRAKLKKEAMTKALECIREFEVEADAKAAVEEYAKVVNQLEWVKRKDRDESMLLPRNPFIRTVS